MKINPKTNLEHSAPYTDYAATMKINNTDSEGGKKAANGFNLSRSRSIMAGVTRVREHAICDFQLQREKIMMHVLFRRVQLFFFEGFSRLERLQRRNGAPERIMDFRLFGRWIFL